MKLTTNQFGQIIGTEVKNWQPCARPEKKILSGTYCVLKPFIIDQHAAQILDVLKFNNTGESWTYLPYGPFETLNSFVDWLQQKFCDDANLLYAIYDVKKQNYVGMCGYLRMDPKHGVIEIGDLHFSKLLQKTPAATEVIYLMLQQVFDELGYRRCEWKCNALNEPSRHAALRFGFTFEGIFRQHLVAKNHNRDTAWFSILDHEWPAIKAKFQRWLDLNNFDAMGRQKTSLREI